MASRVNQLDDSPSKSFHKGNAQITHNCNCCLQSDTTILQENCKNLMVQILGMRQYNAVHSWCFIANRPLALSADLVILHLNQVRSAHYQLILMSFCCETIGSPTALDSWCG